MKKPIPKLLGACLLLLSVISCKKTSELRVSPTVTGPIYADSPIAIDAAFFSVTGNDSTSPKGEILMAMNSNTVGKIFFLDRRGSLIREKTVGIHVEDLQKWNINGQVRYTYFHTEGAITLENIAGTELGYEMICDSNLNILDSVKLVANGSIDTDIQDKLDVHEFILLGDHHYLYDTYIVETPTNIPAALNPARGVQVAACIIQEVNNGQVVFQWDGTQFPEFYTSSQEGNDFNIDTIAHDYMHLNSICVDSADNNLVVSFRNCNEIVKLNRQTGDIMWRLGGSNSDFPQTADQQFLRQHYPRFTDSGRTLIFVDNGLAVVRPYSRIVEFQLDQVNKVITGFKGFQLPTPFIQFAGSVKKEGNEYFVGGAAGLYAAQIDYTTGNVLMKINTKYSSYRALKY